MPCWRDRRAGAGRSSSVAGGEGGVDLAGPMKTPDAADAATSSRSSATSSIKCHRRARAAPAPARPLGGRVGAEHAVRGSPTAGPARPGRRRARSRGAGARERRPPARAGTRARRAGGPPRGRCGRRRARRTGRGVRGDSAGAGSVHPFDHAFCVEGRPVPAAHAEYAGRGVARGGGRGSTGVDALRVMARGGIATWCCWTSTCPTPTARGAGRRAPRATPPT
jgi:hypothetical protein